MFLFGLCRNRMGQRRFEISSTCTEMDIVVYSVGQTGRTYWFWERISSTTSSYLLQCHCPMIDDSLSCHSVCDCNWKIKSIFHFLGLLSLFLFCFMLLPVVVVAFSILVFGSRLDRFFFPSSLPSVFVGFFFLCVENVAFRIKRAWMLRLLCVVK